MVTDARLLTFEVGGRRFALPSAVVREVVRAVAITPLPKAPPIVEGVINVRGTIVPALDIRDRFGLASLSVAPDQHFIIARSAGREVSLRVDRALELTSVPTDAIQTAARAAPGAQYVAGVAALADGLLVIHDLDRFLSLEEAADMDAALVGGESTDRGTEVPTRGA